ncbi:MAG: tetratricopeptide repeat protein [bacterium]|nr:tetratricopeptide repeat protein [bacterium]
MKLRAIKTEIVLIIISIILIIGMFVLNDTIKDIRLDELKIVLQQTNSVSSSLDHISLVMNYRNHKKSYRKKISPAKADMIEIRVNSILLSGDIKEDVLLEKEGYFKKPVLILMNFIRRIAGKRPIENVLQKRSSVALDIAYYYERNKLYGKAITLYQQILNEGKFHRAQLAGIMLHQGYCHSIVGNYQQAIQKYMLVIKNYGDEKPSITAAILLRYLEGFTSEIKRIIKKEDSVKKGKQLYRLIAYREALKVFLRVEKDAKSKEKAEINYYKGRCYEELSDRNKALQVYQETIISDPKSEYAKYSNRRVYLSGVRAHNGAVLKELAFKNNLLLKDEALIEMRAEEKRIAEKAPPAPVKNDSFNEALAEIEKETPVFSRDEIKTIEKIIQKVNKEVEKSSRTAPVIKKNLKYKIFTTDGSSFIGTITGERAGAILFKTNLGNTITIEKKYIKSRVVIP